MSKTHLILEDGLYLGDEAFRAGGKTFGEAVFNTFLIMTYPIIGNCGIKWEAFEAKNMVRRICDKRKIFHSSKWTEPMKNLKNNREKWGEIEDLRVVVLECGVKFNILRILKNYGCKVTVIPAFYTVGEILNLKPDGVFLSRNTTGGILRIG